jgi:hypothetical protein
MLAKAAGVEDPSALPPDADAVVKECDRLPLALALCGGMVYGGTSWADLIEALRQHDLKFLSDAHPGEEQHANVLEGHRRQRARDARGRAPPFRRTGRLRARHRCA